MCISLVGSAADTRSAIALQKAVTQVQSPMGQIILGEQHVMAFLRPTTAQCWLAVRTGTISECVPCGISLGISIRAGNQQQQRLLLLDALQLYSIYSCIFPPVFNFQDTAYGIVNSGQCKNNETNPKCSHLIKSLSFLYTHTCMYFSMLQEIMCRSQCPPGLRR